MIDFRRMISILQDKKIIAISFKMEETKAKPIL
jgi:hypothetical protein